MKNKKLLLVLIVILISIVSLCACAPKSTQIYTLHFITDLPLRDISPIGEFRLASMSSSDSYSRQFEVLPQDKEDFIEFMKQNKYYIGNYVLSEDCNYLREKKRCKVFKAGDECMWFAALDYVWLGKFYANKFYYLTYFPMKTMENNDIFLDVTEAIFSDKEDPTEIDVEYKCPLTWEQLKLIYKHRKIDEQNHTVELNCYLFRNDEYPDRFYGSTLLHFNVDNNTVKISGDFTEIEVTNIEDIWPYL